MFIIIGDCKVFKIFILIIPFFNGSIIMHITCSNIFLNLFFFKIGLLDSIVLLPCLVCLFYPSLTTLSTQHTSLSTDMLHTVEKSLNVNKTWCGLPLIPCNISSQLSVCHYFLSQSCDQNDLECKMWLSSLCCVENELKNHYLWFYSVLPAMSQVFISSMLSVYPLLSIYIYM